MFVWYFLSVIGLFTVLEFLHDTFRSPFQILWSLIFRRSSLAERYGPWAVVTGSSDGIGRQYALNLARAGMNVMLISRTESKLEEVAQEIRSVCHVEVRWIAVDFSDGPHVFERIRSAFAGLDIGVLVNNVGFIHEHPIKMEEISDRELLHSLTVNLYPTMKLTHILLPEMKRRRRGILVNVSSGAGYCPLPFATVYAASKAFVNAFSQGLQEELQGSGVECQLVNPMVVNTRLSVQWQTRPFTRLISAGVEIFGRTATWMIGKTDYTSGCLFHALQTTLAKLFPRRFVSKGISLYFRSVRNEAKRRKGNGKQA